MRRFRTPAHPVHAGHAHPLVELAEELAADPEHPSEDESVLARVGHRGEPRGGHRGEPRGDEPRAGHDAGHDAGPRRRAADVTRPGARPRGGGAT